MIPIGARDAAAFTGARLVGDASASFTSVSIDTRTLRPGALFVAIRGPHHDAHAYLGTALDAGARGVLVERAAAVPEGATALIVEDTTTALGALASGHRSRFEGPVVAVTGSNGKTTTKEMCAAILSLRAPCLKNRGNLNNAYGLPLTLLEREAQHRALVVEIGMNHRGEIAPLAAIARPTVGVITNVGKAHIEHLGSQDEIALEKGDLVAALEADAVAVLNADDPRALAQAKRTRARVCTFGSRTDAEVRAEAVEARGVAGYAFRLVTPDGACDVKVAGLGAPTVLNALAAAAAALAAGAKLPDVAEGLARHAPVGGRMQHRALARGVTVIDDSYNANPQSMEVALHSLARLSGSSASIAVLGDMGELGETGPTAHREAGALAARLGVDVLLAVGEQATLMVAGALESGMDADRAFAFEDHDAATEALVSRLGGGEWILVKGSRSMKMETVIEGLALRWGEGPA